MKRCRPLGYKAVEILLSIAAATGFPPQTVSAIFVAERVISARHSGHRKAPAVRRGLSFRIVGLAGCQALAVRPAAAVGSLLFRLQLGDCLLTRCFSRLLEVFLRILLHLIDATRGHFQCFCHGPRSSRCLSILVYAVSGGARSVARSGFLVVLLAIPDRLGDGDDGRYELDQRGVCLRKAAWLG